jgi:hypothetical protein
VLFVDGEALKIPNNELARDTVMPEGPPDDMKIMCALLTAIPRDGDNNSELWTTVDQNKTNVRSKAVMKLIQVYFYRVLTCVFKLTPLRRELDAGILSLPGAHGEKLLLREQDRVSLPGPHDCVQHHVL